VGTSAEAPASSSPPVDDATPRAEDAPAPETPDAEPTPSTGAEAASSEPPSDEPTDDPADDPAEVVEETLGRYYELLPDDPDAAYDMTGPYLRSQASRSYYRDFWAPWEEVDLREVRGAQQSGNGVVTATTEVEFTGDDGREQTERHQVRLVQDDDGDWLVDLDLVA
jgi:hypothetical protein